jgi:hypothetical protein
MDHIGSPNKGKRLLLLGQRINSPKVSRRFQRTGLVAMTVCCLAPASSESENATVKRKASVAGRDPAAAGSGRASWLTAEFRCGEDVGPSL